MRVFVSSVKSSYEEFREAACRAVESLGGQAVRAEDFPASEESPQVACLRGVRSADVTVLLLAGRYGYPQQSGLSATHEEFVEAAERGPVLVFEHVGVDREPRQQEFVEEVQRWAGGRLTASYSTPDELRDALVRALHDHQMSRAAGSADPDEMHRRALDALLGSSRNTAAEPRLHVVVAGGPRQEVLRPARLDDDDLAGQVHREALFGPAAIFDGQQGVRPRFHLLLRLLDRAPALRAIAETYEERSVEEQERAARRRARRAQVKTRRTDRSTSALTYSDGRQPERTAREGRVSSNGRRTRRHSEQHTEKRPVRRGCGGSPAARSRRGSFRRPRDG